MERVVFDTNAYRYLVKDLSWDKIDSFISELRLKEKKRGVATSMSSIVAKELLAHIASKKDSQYDKCLRAAKAMYLHNGNKDNFNMMASLELQISKSFFHIDWEKKIETSNAIGQILYHISTKPTPYTFRKFQHNLNLIRNHVLDAEKGFVDGMKEFVNQVDPKAIDWEIFKGDNKKKDCIRNFIRSEECSLQYAKAIIFTVFAFLYSNGKVSLTNNYDFDDMANQFIKYFPEPIALQKFVLESLVNSNFDLSQNSRANFLWDIQIMYNVGLHTVDGDKLYLITSDKQMLQCATKCNHAFSIYTFDEYMDYLK